MNQSELEQQLPIEQLSLLYKQSTAAFAATAVVLLFILFWIHDLVDFTHLFLWASSITVFNVYLIIWIYLVHRATTQDKIKITQANRFILVYQIQSVCHGFSWGMLPFVMLDVTSPEMKFFSYIVLCGMAAGAIGTTAMIYRIYLSFMLPMMLPTILVQILFFDTYQLFNITTLEFLIIFVVSIIVLAHTFYETVTTSISLMLQNKQLLENTTDSFIKAEAASQAKSSFLTHMSHELRTPLNAVIGYSEIIYENAKDNDFVTIPKDAKKITQAGKHLLSLINNVLDLSKIETGNMDVYIEDVNISLLLEDVKASTETLAEKNNDKYIFQLPENIIMIKSDYTKLSQILINIIGNAVKFTESGEVIINVSEKKHNIQISIDDTGIGMTEDQLKNLATPFAQADISTTKKYGGTGLGMSLTESLAEILNIKIDVKSKIDVGTKFVLTIPHRFITKHKSAL